MIIIISIINSRGGFLTKFPELAWGGYYIAHFFIFSQTWQIHRLSFAGSHLSFVVLCVFWVAIQRVFLGVCGLGESCGVD